MFYLSGQRRVSGDPNTDNEDEFGWYLGDREIIEDKIYNKSTRDSRLSKQVNDLDKNKKSKVEEKTSMKPAVSIFACNDWTEKSADFSFSQDLKKNQNGVDDSTSIEQIEMNSLRKESSKNNYEIDLDMIEKDADHAVFTSSIVSVKESENNDKPDDESVPPHFSRGICYTPERLVRSQEYRILTPSPRYLAIPECRTNNIDDARTKNYRSHRRKIGDLIDAKQFGASHLEALLDSGAPEIRIPIFNRRRLNRDRTTNKKNLDPDSSGELSDPLEIANRRNPSTFQTPDLGSSRSSYERLDSSWDERCKLIRRSSQDDTSGIHSNDWSTDTPSDIQTPICLCDELASASRSFGNSIESKNGTNAINEVVSILQGLEKNPDRAAVLLEEDRFCVVTSGHDHLTRLALAIEPDSPVPPVLDHPDNLVLEIRGKIERLQETTRNVIKEIDVLRQDFECNENKVDDLMDETVTLRRETSEMRYLDDLLNLLDGELERISRRNWPFVFGHSENRAEEMNLVV